MKTKGGHCHSKKANIKELQAQWLFQPGRYFHLPRETSLPGLFRVRVYKYSGQFPGPLICWPDGSPISRSFFATAFKENLQFCDLDIFAL